MDVQQDLGSVYLIWSQNKSKICPFIVPMPTSCGAQNRLSDYVGRIEMNLGLSRFVTKQAIVSLILLPVAEVYLENPDGLLVSKPLLFRY